MSFGRLERGRRGEPISDINVTPLVDVMLVLVVIFIITAPLLASSLRLNLPRSDAASPAQAPRHVEVALDAAGQLFLGDRPLNAQELAAALAPVGRDHPDTEVQLRADAAVPYGRVVEVIGIAQRAGLSRIGFVAEPQASGRERGRERERERERAQPQR